MQSKKLKGLSVTEISGMALAMIILVFLVSVGSTILTNLHETQCQTEDGTWGTYAWNSDYTGLNPVTGTATGCCSSINSTNTSRCNTWQTGEYSINVTDQGVGAMGTFGDWFGIIVIVVVAAAIIGLLISQFRQVGSA